MSLILLRNNLGKTRSINTELWKRCISTLSRERVKSFKILSALQGKEIFYPNRSIIRQSGNISIKKYQSSRKYTGLWKLERFAGIALAFMIPSAFWFESKEFEMVTGLLAILHTYWGCESMCKDYVRSPVVGTILPVLLRGLNITLSVATLMGMYHLIYKDCGIVNTIKKFWAIRGHKHQVAIKK